MTKLDRIDPVSLSCNPRASLSSWLRYQPIVEAAFRMHPRVYSFEPNGYSPATIASRLRDAVRGCLAFDYPCKITKPDLLRWWSETIIRHDKEKIWIGPKEAVTEAPISGTSVSPNGFSFPTLSFEEVTAFALLLAGGRLLGPVKIQQPPDLTLLGEMNVQVLQREDGSVVLI